MNLEMQITLEEGCNTLAIIAQTKESRSKPELLKIGYGRPGACEVKGASVSEASPEKGVASPPPPGRGATSRPS